MPKLPTDRPEPVKASRCWTVWSALTGLTPAEHDFLQNCTAGLYSQRILRPGRGLLWILDFAADSCLLVNAPSFLPKSGSPNFQLRGGRPAMQLRTSHQVSCGSILLSAPGQPAIASVTICGLMQAALPRILHCALALLFLHPLLSSQILGPSCTYTRSFAHVLSDSRKDRRECQECLHSALHILLGFTWCVQGCPRHHWHHG